MPHIYWKDNVPFRKTGEFRPVKEGEHYWSDVCNEVFIETDGTSETAPCYHRHILTPAIPREGVVFGLMEPWEQQVLEEAAAKGIALEAFRGGDARWHEYTYEVFSPSFAYRLAPAQEEPEAPTYSIGDRFRIEGAEYILGSLGHEAVLICLKDGVRWADPVEFEDPWAIPHDTLDQHIDREWEHIQ